MRARHARIKRLWKKAVMRGDLAKQSQAHAICWRYWDRLKARATELAAGI